MGSFLLSIRRPFVADHFHDLPGFVEERHGHNWEAEATFACGDEGEKACEGGRHYSYARCVHIIA